MMSQGVNDLKMQFILQLSELVFSKLQFWKRNGFWQEFLVE